jgi:acyl carrier protein
MEDSAADFERRVIEILAEQCDADPARIVRETNLIELGDSLARVEAVMKLEDEFELTIPDPDIDELRTVGQLIDYLRPRCDGRSRAGSA